MADVERVKSIHVFCRIDSFEDFFAVNLWRQRKLDQDAVHVIASIQVFDDSEKLGSSDCSWGSDLDAGEPQLFAGRNLVFYINFRGGIVTDEHRSQSGTNSCGSERRNFAG